MDSTLKKVSEPSMAAYHTHSAQKNLTKMCIPKMPSTISLGSDNVNRPSHYAYGKIEPIDFIEDKGFNFNLGNVIKYVSRCGKKKSASMSDAAKAIEDLKKARYYLEREIAKREKEYK